MGYRKEIGAEVTTLKAMHLHDMANPKHITKSKKRSQKITIPHELRELQFKSVFLFLDGIDSFHVNIVNKLLNCFRTLGDIEDIKYSELSRIQGIGKKAIGFVKSFFSKVHADSFRSLSEKFESESTAGTDLSIHCSFICKTFLNSMQVTSIYQLAKLDSVNACNLSELDKLALLELRTLYFDPVSQSFQTRSNNDKSGTLNLPANIDNFLNSNLLNESWNDLILFRWSRERGKISFVEIAQAKNLTRERVRQILQRTLEVFQLLYIAEMDFYLALFLNKILERKAPLAFEDICSISPSRLSLKPFFYVAFLSDLFEIVPFDGNLFSMNRKEMKAIVRKVYALADYPWKLKLDDQLSELDVKKKLIYLHAIFATNKLVISERDGVSFVNRKYYGVNALLNSYMLEVDEPVTLERFADLILSSPSCRSFTLKSELERRSYALFVMLIERIDGFFRIERHTWGFEKHLSYSRTCWPEIWDACHCELASLGRQANSGYLFRKIRNKFPKLRSKYELAEILKKDSSLLHLGLLRFRLHKTEKEKESIFCDDMRVI